MITYFFVILLYYYNYMQYMNFCNKDSVKLIILFILVHEFQNETRF